MRTNRTKFVETSDAQEKSLAQRAHAGDRDAFGELLRMFESRVFSLVRRMVRREAEAVEVMQEAFLQAYQSRHRFDPARSFRPWLFKITVNVCRNHIRAAARREVPLDIRDDSSAIWAVKPEDPEGQVLTSDNARLLAEVLDRLNYADRALLLLRFHEEMSYVELKQVYGVPQTVLKMRVHRAVKRLRDLAEGSLQ